MTTIHPDWQSDEGRPVRITVKQPTAEAKPLPAATRITTVSRKPAAFVGIALTLAVVFAVFRPDIGSNTVGQAQNSYKIVLTPDGPIPDTIVAAPGDQIEFLNSFEDPQRIDLSELPTLEKFEAYDQGLYDDIEPWITPDIPFGGSYVTTIDPLADRGEYAYFGVDETADLIFGTVAVEFYGEENLNFPGEDEELPGDETDFPFDDEPLDEPAGDDGDAEPSFEDLYPYDDSIFPGAPSDGDNVFRLPSETLPPDEQQPVDYPEQNLPQNPFTVQYGQMHGAPTPPPYEGFQQQLPAHSGAPLNAQTPTRPVSQPHTGAGHWIVIGLSAVAVIVTTRKAFRRV